MMVGAAAFALLAVVSQTAALATAGGLVLCAGAARRAEDLPQVGLFVVTALVPLSYFGSQVAVGHINSLTKLVFIPAFGVLTLEWVLSRRRLVLGWQSLFVTLFGCAIALSYLLNTGTQHSLWFLSRFVSMMLLFFLCANVLRGERDVVALLAVMAGACTVSAAGSVCMPVLAAPNSFLNNGAVARMTGWATYDAPMFGSDLLVSLLICLYFAFVSRPPWLRGLLAAAACTLVLAIVHTYARGVSLVMGISVVYLLFKLRKRVSLLAVSAALVLLALCLLPLVPDYYWERMSSTFAQFESDSTIRRRADTYRIGLDLFRQSPLVGFGPGNFIAQYMSAEYRFDRSGIPSVCFNLYLSIATQAGLIGLAAFGLGVGCAFRELRFVARSYGADDSLLKQGAEILEVMLVALLLMSLFEALDLQKFLWIVLGATAAVGSIRRKQLAAVAASP